MGIGGSEISCHTIKRFLFQSDRLNFGDPDDVVQKNSMSFLQKPETTAK